MPLLNNDRLFQTLLTSIAPEGSTVEGDLDVDSFDDVPFITHSSFIAQDRNAMGLWSVTLNVSIFLEADNAPLIVGAVYDGIWSWGSPSGGRVPDVGSVESVADQNAFSRLGGAVQMLNKAVTQYVGSFQLTARGA